MQDEQGRPLWERLKARHAIRAANRIQQAAAQDPAALFAFDLLWLNGADFRDQPLIERKAPCIARYRQTVASAMRATSPIPVRSSGSSR